MSAVVGFDRKIKREWLDALADQVAQGHDAAALRTYLHDLLKADHPGETARGKTVTVLMRIWALVPEEHRAIRQQAFDLLKVIPAADRIWLHWGMCLLAYGLFHDTATSVGRLLKLQDDFTLAQLQRRLVEGWGERTTVKRAFQRIVRSMIEWDTLADSETPGHFQAAEKLTTASKPLQLWLLRASHTANGTELVESDQLLNLPSSFPFHLTVSKSDLRHSTDFTLHRQGLSMDMVEVAKNGKPASTDGKKAASKASNNASE